MKRRLGVVSVVAALVATLFTLSALASDAQLYFASDKNGQNRVTNIQEGDEIFIVVIDNDQNIDCDIRDKMWPDLKIFDVKTGAYIVWEPVEDDLSSDYLEETGADTGVFVSKRSFQVGSRESFNGDPSLFAHVVDVPNASGFTDDFQWGHWEYVDNGDADGYADEREWLDYGPSFHQYQTPPGLFAPADVPSHATWADGPHAYIIGRFENMDTLVGLYQDPNDATDVALGMMKIIDTEATISWDQTIYKDANGSATITVVDPDENLNCNEVEYVPVFILINPGSWNPWDTATASPTNFCMLLRQGGVSTTGDPATVLGERVRWYNIYHSGIAALSLDTQTGSDPQPEIIDGVRYVQYPTAENSHDGNGAQFDTVTSSGVVKVQFYAQETGVSTGVFQLNLNSILVDLGFDQLFVRDVLVAYYLDPNDFDDFKLATAYIEEQQHSITSFTDATRADKELYWIGRNPVYVQVIDANANVDPCCPEQVVVHICDPHGEDDSEWLILDETSSNSPVFFTFAGTQLWPVWDALGVGLSDSNGGFQLQLDNWKIEAFNEDSIYVRYNDVYYETDETGMAGLGDATAESTANTAFPPAIQRIRVANDVSFDLMEVADTQVYDGSTVNMYFLDRQGNRVSGYVNSDCVFVEVIDPDQDEDQYRRERIDAFWDGYQNIPFGPMDFNANHEACGYVDQEVHDVNPLLGDTNIFEDYEFQTSPNGRMEYAKLYVLNPRNGRWAAVDLMETGVATGDFVSVICIDLVGVYDCAPTLGVLPGDTILAAYQDPSNHSDVAWISIKVGIGGGGTPPSQASTTMFVDAAGNEVANYTDADTAYVKVIDPSHAGANLLANAVEIDGETYDLSPLAGAQNDTFITAGLELELVAGETLTATYRDPTDPTDTSSDTITIVASELVVDDFYAAPNPFDDEATFGYTGSGIASVMSVAVYDLTGTMVWSDEQTNVTGIVWNGTDETGTALANGAYIYTVTATDGTNTFTGKGLVFISR